jgi:hypothetical protein
MANEVVAVYVDMNEAAPKTLVLRKTSWDTPTKLNKLRRSNYRMIQIIVLHQQDPEPANPNKIHHNGADVFYCNRADNHFEVRDYNPSGQGPERAASFRFLDDATQDLNDEFPSNLAAQAGGGMAVSLQGFDWQDSEWNDLNDEANALTITQLLAATDL